MFIISIQLYIILHGCLNINKVRQENALKPIYHSVNKQPRSMSIIMAKGAWDHIWPYGVEGVKDYIDLTNAYYFFKYKTSIFPKVYLRHYQDKLLLSKIF